MVVFPSFTLTSEELDSFSTDLQELLTSIKAIFSGPKPLSVYDWSEALRFIRDAFAFTIDMHELTPESDTHLARLFLYKGDCFRGLGRVREARNAYRASCGVGCMSAEDRTSQYQAGERLEELDELFRDDQASKRTGGLWNALQTGLNSPDLSLLGYKTELWDPEPPLRIKSVQHWPKRVENRVKVDSWALKPAPGGLVAVKTPGLRSRKRESVAHVRAAECPF